MSTFIVPVVRIGKLDKHENADSLLITEVRGCPVITRTGSFNEGDLAVYIPVDSVVNTDHPELAFLKTGDKVKVRVKAKKLRGVFSMGLLIPAPQGVSEGDDLASVYGIEKYEEPIPVVMSGDAVRGPEGIMVPSYDLESLRTYKHMIEDEEQVVVTEKIHGSNARFYLDSNGTLHVGSRTLFRDSDGASVWARVARENDLASKLSGLSHYVFYGEVFGSGVQDLSLIHI